MITDDQLLKNVANLLGVDSALIRSEVQIYKAQAIAKLFARTKPWWIKSREQWEIGVGEYLLEPKIRFPDFWQLRNIRPSATADRMEIMSEGRFLKQFSDDSIAGTPSICIALDAENLQIYPRPSTTLTLYLGYFYSPKHDTISSVREQWQHVIQDYVLAMMWPDTNQRVDMLRFFLKGLEDVANMAKPITEDAIDIEADPLSGYLYQTMAKER